MSTARSTVRHRPDTLDLAVFVTRALPRGAGFRLAWHLGHRARRVPRVARLKTGGRLVTDVGDYTQRFIYFLGEYEPETTQLLHRLAYPGWTVLDVGANAGYFSVVAAKLGGPRSRIVAFEPNPKLADMIVESIPLNPDLNIVLERAGCGDQADVMTLYLSPYDRNSGLSTLRTDLFPDATTTEVPVVRLDDYCIEHDLRPDLLKIDVEGFEPQVLRGAGWIIDERVPSWVVCEITPERDDPSGLIASMHERGYECSQITENGDLAPLEKVIHFGNVCFSRI